MQRLSWSLNSVRHGPSARPLGCRAGKRPNRQLKQGADLEGMEIVEVHWGTDRIKGNKVQPHKPLLKILVLQSGLVIS